MSSHPSPNGLRLWYRIVVCFQYIFLHLYYLNILDIFKVEVLSKCESTITIITMNKKAFTAILKKEGSVFVALCPELDVASQGESVESALANLKEAVELFLECADAQEIADRLHEQVFVTRFEAVYA